MARASFSSVDAYVAALPAPTRAVVQKVRALLRKALPGAAEEISYQIPVFKLDGEMVLFLAGYARHFAIYPATGRMLEELADELAPHLHGRATLRFSVEERVPERLLTRVAKLRAADAADAAARRAAKGARKPTTLASAAKGARNPTSKARAASSRTPPTERASQRSTAKRVVREPRKARTTSR